MYVMTRIITMTRLTDGNECVDKNDIFLLIIVIAIKL